MKQFCTGRLFSPDKKDLQYLVPDLRRKAKVITKKLWSPGPRLDQGQTSSCVGHAWWKAMQMGPVTNKLRMTPIQLYEAAQKVDEWPGENYDGTSVRAGADVLVSDGRIREYRWAPDIEAAINWVLTTGPMVFGTAWPDQMFYPTKLGKITIVDFPENTNLYWAGGHAYVINGVDRNLSTPNGKGAARILNSWGEEWGDRGEAWISFKKLEILLRYGGEACCAYEI